MDSAPNRGSTWSWFVKARRASDGTETWKRGGVSPTLNASDNTGDVRATVLAVAATSVSIRGRDGEPAFELGTPGGPANSLSAATGRQGGPMVAVETVLGDIAHTLTADGSDGSDGSEDGTGRGTPVIAVPVDLRNAARASGTGAGTQGLGVGAEGDPSFTLSATQRAIPGVSSGTLVRRLSPVECERLQDFPDGWTAEGVYDDGVTRPVSDSQRYREMGNAVTVAVPEWILGRILAVEGGQL